MTTSPGGFGAGSVAAGTPAIAAPAAGVAGLHLFTFNQVQQTEQWRKELLARINGDRAPAHP